MKLEPGKEIELQGYIVASEYGFITWSASDMASQGWTVIIPHALKFTVPAEFNPISAEVAAIEKKLDTMADEYHGKVKQLKDRIQELLCIENNTGAA